MINKVPYIKQTVVGGLYDFTKKRFTKTDIPNRVIKNGRKIRTSGCGLCSTAMALYWCTGKYINPIELKEKYVPNQGSKHDIGYYEARKRGVYAEYTANIDKVVSALNNGCCVMSIQGKGAFTKRGHYILLIGTKDGKIAVNDPASSNRTYRMSGKLWSKSQIDNTTKKSDGKGYTIFYPLPIANVKKNDEGIDVKRWQLFLRFKGYTLSIDGKFGPKTEELTKKYQKSKGIKVDGHVGMITRGKAKADYKAKCTTK